MNKVEKFDKETATDFGNEVFDAVKAIAEKYGVTARHVSGTYDVGGGSLKERYEFTVGDADTLAWNQYAERYGFALEDLGRTFENEGETLTIIGLKLGRNVKVRMRRESDGAIRIADAEFVKDWITGRDPFAEREKAALESLKKGDAAYILGAKPRYLDYTRLEVLSIDKKAKTARVMLHQTSNFADQRVKDRFNADGELTVPLTMLVRIELPKRPENVVSIAGTK
jgi:hypothetical protein